LNPVKLLHRPRLLSDNGPSYAPASIDGSPMSASVAP